MAFPVFAKSASSVPQNLLRRRTKVPQTGSLVDSSLSRDPSGTGNSWVTFRVILAIRDEPNSHIDEQVRSLFCDPSGNKQMSFPSHIADATRAGSICSACSWNYPPLAYIPCSIAHCSIIRSYVCTIHVLEAWGLAASSFGRNLSCPRPAMPSFLGTLSSAKPAPVSTSHVDSQTSGSCLAPPWWTNLQD